MATDFRILACSKHPKKSLLANSVYPTSPIANLSCNEIKEEGDYFSGSSLDLEI